MDSNKSEGFAGRPENQPESTPVPEKKRRKRIEKAAALPELVAQSGKPETEGEIAVRRSLQQLYANTGDTRETRRDLNLSVQETFDGISNMLDRLADIQREEEVTPVYGNFKTALATKDRRREMPWLMANIKNKIFSLFKKKEVVTEEENLPIVLEKSNKEVIRQAGMLLSEGVSRIVAKADPGYEPIHDTQGVLYLLKIAYPNQKIPSVAYFNRNEPLPKEELDRSEEKTTVYINATEEPFSADMEKRHVFANQEKLGMKSASRAMAEALMDARLINENPPWLQNMLRFMDEIRTMSYLEEKGKDKQPLFNQKNFIEQWPRSLYGIYKMLPFEGLVEVFKTERNAFDPFTDEELDGDLGNFILYADKEGKPMTLRDIIRKREIEAKKAANGIYHTEKESFMLNNKGNKHLGKVAYHNFARITPKQGGKSFINMIPNDVGYAAARVQGYDSFIVFNPQKRSFFINSALPGIEEIYKKLAEKIPGTVFKENSMIFSPATLPEGFNEKEFKKILGY